MTIKVTAVSEGWRATPTSDPLYTIAVEGHAEPQKTYDPALNVIGEHEAESFQSKTGKTYWRKPGNVRRSAPKEFKADPQKLKQDFTLAVAQNLSIQRQVAVKGVVELIVAGKRDYKDLQVTFDDLMGLLSVHRDATPTDEEVENINLDEVEL